MRKKKKEDKFNIPDILCYSRVLIGIIFAYLLFNNYNVWTVTIVFVIGALTDGLDGFFARLLHEKTEYGRKLDIITDRIFMITVVVSTIIFYIMTNNTSSILLIGMIMSREIIATPFWIIAVFRKGNITPHARKIAKLTTFLQGFAFSFVLLNWQIALYTCIITCATGALSGILYAFDSSNKSKKIPKVLAGL